jgi:hypothetical protein
MIVHCRSGQINSSELNVVTALYRYLIYGLAVESEIQLSSVHETTADREPAAIRIARGLPDDFRGLAVGEAADPDDWLQHVVLSDGRVYMKAENVFQALVSRDGRNVICAALGDVDQRSLEANLMNFVLSASLTLQGEEPLHSTVVDIDGRAVGLLGLSGAGKSTLGAFLISRGAELVTDDMLRVKFTDGGMLAYPGPYRLKMFEEAGRRLLPDAVANGHFNQLSGKVMMQPRARVEAHRPPVPLVALFHLGLPDEPRAGETVCARRVLGLDLAKAVLSSAMDTRYSEPPRLARQIRFAARVARTLPVYGLHYPRSFDVFDEVAKEIHRPIRS